jgi:hypothetical protein
MEPKHLFTIRWTQSYPGLAEQQALMKELVKLKDDLIEQLIDEGDFAEANEVIARIKGL